MSGLRVPSPPRISTDFFPPLRFLLRSRSIPLESVSADVFEELLYFAYTDRLRRGDAFDAHGCDLLRAADAFDLPGLRVACEKRLASALSVGNVCALLGAARMCR